MSPAAGGTLRKEGGKEARYEGEGKRKERRREGRARHQSSLFYDHEVPVFVLSAKEKSLPWKVRNRKFPSC